MKHYRVDVMLGGEQNHVVTGKVVTVPEIAVLRALHGGEAAVKNIRPCQLAPDDERNERTIEVERERLRSIYNGAGTDAGGSIVDSLWNGLAALPQRLADIGIDPRRAADEMRARAAELTQAAATLEDEPLPEDDDDEAAMFADLDLEPPPPAANKGRAKTPEAV